MAHHSLLTMDGVAFLKEFLEEALGEAVKEAPADQDEDQILEMLGDELFEGSFPILGLAAEGLSLRREMGKAPALAPLRGANRRPSMFNLSAAKLVGFDDYFVQSLCITEDLEATIIAFEKIDDWNGT